MAAPADLYSQIVGWAKILLPLSALVLLSTLFLFARSAPQADQVALAQATTIAREQRLSAPEFSGVTDDGSIVTISADKARPDPDNPDRLIIDNIALEMRDSAGNGITVNAVTGDMNGRDRTARFGGLVRLATSTGYQMETTALIADLDSGRIHTDAPLEVRAPFGQMSAGQAQFEIGQDLSRRMLFTGGVRLLYVPSG